MLITRGWLTVLCTDVKIQKAGRQANYSPNYKKSATVGVNYSLTITLSMVLKAGESLRLCVCGIPDTFDPRMYFSGIDRDFEGMY